ncbi:MAG: helix-turn-helix domain-containing protein [Pseudomonadota bacterium]
MKIYRPSRAPCPIGRSARILGDRWVLLILREAFLGVDRFEQFIERLEINRAALTSRLTILQESGLIERVPPQGRKARYVLTERGTALQPLFAEMSKWGSDHLFDKTEPAKDWS